MRCCLLPSTVIQCSLCTKSPIQFLPGALLAGCPGALPGALLAEHPAVVFRRGFHWVCGCSGGGFIDFEEFFGIVARAPPSSDDDDPDGLAAVWRRTVMAVEDAQHAGWIELIRWQHLDGLFG